LPPRVAALRRSSREIVDGARPISRRDLSSALALGTKHRDLLALFQAQIPARDRVQQERRHAATLTKPPDASR
jgi:hypothetical protein